MTTEAAHPIRQSKAYDPQVRFRLMRGVPHGANGATFVTVRWGDLRLALEAADNWPETQALISALELQVRQQRERADAAIELLRGR